VPGDLTVNGPATVRLSGPDQIASGATVDLNSVPGPATLDLNGQSQTIASLSNAAGGTIELGGGTLTVNDTGPQSFSGQVQGAGTLVKQGAGTLTLTAGTLQSCGLSVTGGEVAVEGPGADTVTSLSLSGGKLDLGTSRLLIDYAAGSDPVSNIRSYLSGGSAAALVSDGLPLGYGDSADGVVAGLPRDAVVVKPTLAGDANLDGQVGFSDLLIVAQNYNGTQAAWTRGDFNGDGKVDFADLLLMAQNYGKTAPSGN